MLSSLKSQNTSKVFTALASIAASAILVRTIYGVRRQFFTSNYKSSPFFVRQKTIIIEEYTGDDSVNQEFQAVDTYLVTEVSSSVRRLRVRKDWDMKKLVTKLEINEEIVDVFKNVEARWRLIFKKAELTDQRTYEKYMKSSELTFDKKHEQMVLNSYLPYIMERGKAIREESKVINLYPLNFEWGDSEYFDFDHPITFKTLAVDSEVKTAVLDDLNTFMNAQEYYRNTDKPWKRGYFIYGPPGTGKSSLTAAMANHLNYDIYDLDVSQYARDPDFFESWVIPVLRSRTIVVVEDIDCTIKLQNQELEDESEKQVTVSDILNQLRLCPGDGQIFVFTTNHADMLDPELLTPGLMDMHIHMPYCTISAFNQLAFNHFDISHHTLFEEIEGLIKKVEVTLAEVSGELMKSSDAEVSLQGLIKFLHSKVAEYDKSKSSKQLRALKHKS